ncbi:hypothetical protein CONLIGDRAFT_671618 [Coniochaeta ligniaria NRRL 30616]|uniref:RNA polymerase I-specific transcription initiation factor RRN6-like protein n=1 Tax=Coniochaeta ligniaria NRRL 30616 TaxID=1408157 RepID=A0A1J7IKX6_9PEZI|nr:hypothetical protein CONLIGDRAFT_671618 [Coniochaeta ligniaria NRRL 30616]
MADTKMSAPATERPLPNVAVAHRLNHIDSGNIGRVAYSPADNDAQQVGKLQTGRSLDSNQHFKLLSHFTEVLPPTRSVLPEAASGQKPSDAARSQKNWLLEHHPEAAAGGGLDAQTLADGLRTLKAAASEDDAAASSLLAVGEIADRTNLHSGTVGQPAIAMAAGEGGHILRIIPLVQEDTTWTDLSVRLTKVSSSARGDWAGDGVPINMIKFAVDGRRYDPIRWVLVQRPTGTTLLEPHLGVMPFQGGMSEYELSNLYSTMPRYISVNPLFTIEARKTGGAAHVDACFNPVVDGRSPQLAIIDDLGQWSVWDITGSRSVTPKMLQPMLTARGSIDVGPVPSLRSRLGKDPATHKLLYVLPQGEHRIKRQDEQEDFEHQYGGLYSRSPVRSNHLLVCSATDVRHYDAIHGLQLAGIRVVNVNRAESILDMQSCPMSHSQAFVLTTSSLYWIDTKVASHGQFRISVILSFPHHRRTDAGALMLSVSSLASATRSKSCAAFIVSGQDKATDMFIFTNPSAEEVAHSVHQVVCTDLPPSIRSIFTTALPVGRNDRTKGKATRSGRSVSDPDHTRVFQLFGLKSDLSLGSALLAMSDIPLHDLDAAASVHGTTQSDKLRKKYLRHVENTFVVPDSYQERSALSLSDAEIQRHRPDADQKPVKKRHDVINLEAACERLAELAASEITPTKISRQLLAGVIHQRGMEELGDNDHMRVRTLSELVGPKLNACNLDTLEEEWTTFRSELDSAYEGKVQVAELDGGNLPKDLQSLTWQLSSLSYVPEDTPDAHKEKQRHLLRHLSGKQHLSLFGIAVVSPATTDPESLPSQLPTQTPPSSSLLLPSSPPALGANPSQDAMAIDPPPSQPVDTGPLSRLRKYIDIPPTPATTPLSHPPASRLLSHWPPVSADPSSYLWEEDLGPLTAEDEEAMLKRQRRDEARRRRSIKQRLSMGLPLVGEDDVGRRGEGLGQGSSYAPPTPRVALSSQPRGGEGSQSQSQSQGQSQRPRISMSQVVPGTYGGRPGGVGGKKKKKGGFR